MRAEFISFLNIEDDELELIDLLKCVNIKFFVARRLANMIKRPFQ